MKKAFTTLTASKLVIAFIAIMVIWINFNQSPWRGTSGVIKYDVISYYAYLPATFIEKDLSLSFINDSNVNDYIAQNKYWPQQLGNGKYVIKTTMGLSILYAPFFFIANMSAAPLGYAQDGFSLPYKFAIQFSGLLYLLIGLFVLRKVLLGLYSEKVTAITLFLLFFASNLLCYTTLEAPYSHQYSFFLLSLFLYFSQKWLAGFSLKYCIYLGITLGLMILIRPINLLFAAVILFYNIQNLQGLKHRFLLLLKKVGHLLVIGVLSFLVLLPQLLYWKQNTGSWFFNSYVGEQFFFFKPHLLQGLLGFRKGWLIYTPLFFLLIPGFYFLRKEKSPWFIGSLFVLLIYFYVVESWWCWWYGGSFGLRPMIDLYPLLAFPLAAFITKMQAFKKSVKIGCTALLVIFVLLNCFQTIQYHYNVIHYDSMTVKAYANRFFKTSRFDAQRSYLQRPDYQSALKGIDATVPFEGE